MPTPDDEDERLQCEEADFDLVDVLTGFEEITPENCHGLLLEGDAEGNEAW